MDAPSTSSREDGQDLQPSVPSHPLPPWNPCHAWFKPYSRYSQIRTPQKSSPLRVIVNRPLVVRLTKDILETYQICNPNFTCCESVYVKRFLTNPSEAVLNDGFDNENSDLVLFVNLVLVNPKNGQRYVVKDMLGQGTFGQVVKCWHLETNSLVAVKIIKNQPAYYHQALVEVSILAALNQMDPEDKHHIVRMHDYFLHQNHLCISFEMLSVNLYDLIKLNHFKGISTNLIRVFSKQMLDALIVMKKASIIHCDLKPENVLLVSFQSGEIKIIDFGSACMENRTVYSYIQSRYYRSPEVLLGYQYTTAIDMWSFGCIIAELFLGLPLFPGLSEFDLIRRMQETLGGQPPDYMLREAKNAHKFFKHVGRVHCLDGIDCVKGHQSAFQFLTEEEYEAKQLQKPTIGKQYFSHVKLEDIIAKYPYKKILSAEETSQENRTRVVLLDFLRGLIHFDPVKRWTPSQAVLHPFITNEPFMRPYEPTPETPFIPVCQPLTVNHNPGSGHWFVAGLSPQVSNMNRGMPIKNSPYVQAVPFSYACSYGSVGSIGSHNDGIDLGSSFESYADSGLRSYYSTIGPPGLNTLTQGVGTILGSSPDARWRVPNASHGNELGVSPSYGNFRAMSLGASPSQFTPPGSQFSISAGSPSMYCPTSPRCGSHGSPLGKGAAISQYSRRRSLGQPGMMSMSPQECITSQHSMGNYNDGVNTEGKPRVHSSDNMYLCSAHPCLPHLRVGCGSLSATLSSSKEASSVSALHLHCIDYSSMQTAYDKPECSSSMPDPGDWDPNYSDDLLLEENSAEMNSLCSGVASGMLLSHSPGSSNSGAGIGGRFNSGVDQFHQPLNYTLANQRSNVPTQTYACMDGSTSLARGDTHFAYGRPITRSSYHMSHAVPHSSPSHRGQQSFPRFNNPLQMAFVQDERMHSRGPYWKVGPHSPGKSAFANDSSWGQRAGHAVTIPPPRPRTKESARIS